MRFASRQNSEFEEPGFSDQCKHSQRLVTSRYDESLKSKKTNPLSNEERKRNEGSGEDVRGESQIGPFPHNVIHTVTRRFLFVGIESDSQVSQMKNGDESEE